MENEPNDAPPCVRVAAFCETVLQEKSGTLTLVRMIDRISVAVVEGDEPEEMPESYAQVVFVLSTVAGLARGPRTLRIRILRGDGSDVLMANPTHVHTYERESHAHNWVVSVRLRLRHPPGTLWLEAFSNDNLLTRIPFQVVYERSSRTTS